MKTFKMALERRLERDGVDVDLSAVNKVSKKYDTLDEAVVAYYALTLKRVDPDLYAYQMYLSLIGEADFLAQCRAEVGETSRVEDLCGTDADHEAEKANYTRAISRCMVEAEEYLPAAKRWADSVRVELPRRFN